MKLTKGLIFSKRSLVEKENNILHGLPTYGKHANCCMYNDFQWHALKELKYCTRIILSKIDEKITKNL